MSQPESYEPETNPNVKWYQRGGFTTIAMMGLVLGAVCWIAIGAGAVFGDFSLVRGFVPYPALVGFALGLFGYLGPWKLVATGAVVLSIGAGVLVFFL